MGLISKITNKIESKILHRDGSHSYPKELPPKDDSPHIDPSAPVSSPGEGIQAEDFAHRIRRSESAQRSDHEHELPVPNSSETWVRGQRRYYAQRGRGQEEFDERQREGESVYGSTDEVNSESNGKFTVDPLVGSSSGDERNGDVGGPLDVVEERNGVVKAEEEAEALRCAQKAIDERKGLEKLSVVGI